jgi:hypothetical protein
MKSIQDRSELTIEVIRARFPQLEAIRCLLLPIETVDELVTWP